MNRKNERKGIRMLFFLRLGIVVFIGIISTFIYSEDIPNYLDEDWQPLSPNWTDGLITSVGIDNNNIVYCGGTFTSINGVSANRVARWNGINWQAMGQGFNNAVEKICISTGGEIYAVGSFTYSGSNLRNRVAKWNGSSWVAVGSGFNDAVYTVTITNNGTVFVGGKFTQSGSTPINRIAYWNGSQWVEPYLGVSGGTSPYVLSLTSDSNGNIYAGGQFQYAGNVSANNIARWDGTNWHSLGTGINGPVYSLAVDETGRLYAGGSFTQAGGVNVSNISIWDGSSWTSLDGGVNGIVYSILPKSSQSIFIGGNFSIAGGNISANGLAWWYSGNWRSITSGVNGSNKEIRSLVFDSQGNLYVGGDFYYAGGKISYKITELKRPPIFTVTYTADIGGNILGNATQNIMRGNDGTEVIAVADSGYLFDHWSDGLLTPNRKDTNIIENKNYVAYFTLINEGYGEGEGIPEGIPTEGEGIIDGEAEGIFEGEGIIEGESEGSPESEGIIDGEPEGSIEGIFEGEGDLEGDSELIAWIEGETYINKIVGESQLFTIHVEGAQGNIGYEWYYCKDYLCPNPTIIPYVSGQELYIEDLSVEDSGWYWCHVSDDLNVVETPKVYLHVSHGLSITNNSLLLIFPTLLLIFVLRKSKVYHR
ncbi:MAG: InlB B-repeat-containing protein [Candidatus Hydrogenedens sp.]